MKWDRLMRESDVVEGLKLLAVCEIWGAGGEESGIFVPEKPYMEEARSKKAFSHVESGRPDGE